MEFLLIVAAAVGVFWWLYKRAKPKAPTFVPSPELRPLRSSPAPAPKPTPAQAPG